MSDKLTIQNEMKNFDSKNRDFYDSLTDDEKKKFSNFVLLRWGSVVSGQFELQQYYLQAMNERVNKHFWDLNKHPKLQWLLLTTVSPDMGNFRHDWIAFNGRKPKNKRAKLFAELYPELKDDECELMATMHDADVKNLLTNLGWNDKSIKDAMK